MSKVNLFSKTALGSAKAGATAIDKGLAAYTQNRANLANDELQLVAAAMLHNVAHNSNDLFTKVVKVLCKFEGDKFTSRSQRLQAYRANAAKLLQLAWDAQFANGEGGYKVAKLSKAAKAERTAAREQLANELLAIVAASRWDDLAELLGASDKPNVAPKTQQQQADNKVANFARDFSKYVGVNGVELPADVIAAYNTMQAYAEQVKEAAKAAKAASKQATKNANDHSTAIDVELYKTMQTAKALNAAKDLTSAATKQAINAVLEYCQDTVTPIDTIGLKAEVLAHILDLPMAEAATN